MSEHSTSSLLAVTLMTLVLITCSDSTSSRDPGFESATFELPEDPKRVLLDVSARGGFGPGNRYSMRLYGDGRLILQEGKGSRWSELARRELEQAEVETFLRQAIRSGLAEWDSARVSAHQRVLNNGKLFTTPTDQKTVTVLLSVDDYRRGKIKFSRVDKRMEVYAPIFLAERHPRIAEIEGVARLTRYMYDWIREGENSGS